MGIYLNPGNQAFAEALNSEIYVDKSGLIEYTNKVLGTKQKYVCVSRSYGSIPSEKSSCRST